MEPTLALDAYRVNAALDWVYLLVRFKEPTTYRAVRGILTPHLDRVPYVRPVDHGRGSAGHIFNIEHHDPTETTLNAITAALAYRSDVDDGPRPIAMEVAVDFYPDDATDESRQQMVGLLQRHFLPLREAWVDPNGRPRTTATARRVWGGRWTGRAASKSERPPSTSRMLDKANRRQRQPWVDGTYYVGTKKADVMWRIQDKVGDERVGSTFKALSAESRRARIEVMLKGEVFEKLNIATIADLKAFEFEKLAGRYFSFWLATLPKQRVNATDLLSIVNNRIRESYWQTFAEMGVLGVLRRDQEMLTVLAASNKQQPSTRKLREPDGRPKVYQIGRASKEKDADGNQWRVGTEAHLMDYEALSERVRHALGDLRLSKPPCRRATARRPAP